MPTISQSMKFDELHLQEIASKARTLGSKRGYLLKADPKQKKVQHRWCCVYQNLFFYFESESVTKPLGVIFLERTSCKPVGSVAGQRDGGFCVLSENPAAKQYYFCAGKEKEREEWIEALSNANMTKLQYDLEDLRRRCDQLESSLGTSATELQHLREANQRNKEDMKKIIQLSPRRRTFSTATHPTSSTLCPSPSPIPPSPDPMEESARVIQSYFRGWLIRRKWRKIIHDYLQSSAAEQMRKRNQLVWNFVAAEEDYVSQLTVLNEDYLQQCDMAACSCHPPLSLEQCKDIFRNSDELLLLHQMFLRGLHDRIDKWPVVHLGDVLKLFVPMMVIYHEFNGNHQHAMDIFLPLKLDPSFNCFLATIQERPTCSNMALEDLLSVPLKRISTYVHDLQELLSLTPPEHVDFDLLHEAREELEAIQKAVTDEVCLQTENSRRVLQVEKRLEGGCPALLDCDQVLVREGVLHQARAEDRTSSRGTKLRSHRRHCFLFSKHLLITTHSQKKAQEMYKTVKVLPLSKCSVEAHENCENPELSYRAIKVAVREGEETNTILLLAGSVAEKVQWLADFAQCIENEKQAKIQSLGESVELNSKFIRYNTFRTGKERLVNSATVDSLLTRLINTSSPGLDFLNTFFMTYTLYTESHCVIDFLSQSYNECIATRERRKRASLNPQEAVRGARAILVPERLRAASVGVTGCNTLTSPAPQSPRNSLERSPLHRRGQNSSNGDGGGMGRRDIVNGVFLALKHWICKHFHHFREDDVLAEKVEMLIQHATDTSHLQPEERILVLETDRLYMMQLEGEEEEDTQLEKLKDPQPMPPHPFELVLLWKPRETAEQLCLIESSMFSKVDSDELLMYFRAKGEAKAKVAPHIAAIVDHFNRTSLFFRWAVVSQRYPGDRVNVIEFLIQLATECVQLNNFSSFMQVLSGLNHGSVQHFKTAWEGVSKTLMQEYRSLEWLSSTEGRFKELKSTMRKAHPPLVPYLGTVLNDLSGVVEAMPTHLHDNFINFNKMRRCTRLILDTLHHQKEPYDFPLVQEVSKIILTVPIPGNEDDLYRHLDTLPA